MVSKGGCVLDHTSFCRFGDNSVQDTINSHSVQQLTTYCAKYKESFGSSSEPESAVLVCII